MNQEQIRAEFEAWADGEGYDLQRNELTDYEAGATRIAWSAWQASRAALVGLDATQPKLAIRVYNSGYMAGHHDTVESVFVDVMANREMDLYHGEEVRELLADLARLLSPPKE